ncbi:NAD(P)-dependent dehydrogenase (short-subunit alcohol dehydrogenase family) [Actinoplanes lutulentus]|uniref:NAD(P)-dependent dehydrogenase (Short-subunit alcohol dehydrogenase family) n=1 Tax=Actinoplanes lutulentus TaxID=1287878 RepID=A0A327ZL43_9ACTN|nr:oxidoreductase [Actinoplanes lutulentus]MBB2940704.1 NAD(P)-dependent dehydrogenase (short-subunit alcohol dehydrogenase family) [Actinoplanes lutulentus]RAK43015.1 NAD(P)-dependent dehydrogenase (short-subunit alcohol dehydrogenase family) [Actinoplanes lutulentus]
MNLELAGKKALVTGASRGIGLAIVRALVGEGATVVAGSRSTTPELAALAETGNVHPVNADLSTAEGAAEFVEQGIAVLGGLDVLVNNVGGVRPRVGGFLSVTEEDWQQALDINFLSAVRVTRAALPHLLEHGGNIVTINSVNSWLPDPLVIDYSASKAALVNFSKSLSKEFGPRGVRVNTISPGPVETDLWLGSGGVAETVGGSKNLAPEEVAKGAVSGTATGRFTRPDEVADLVLLLAGGRAANITGSDIVIDGGLITTL